MYDFRTETYKAADGSELEFDVFRPANAEKTPAIVLVFGGGWSNGDHSRFHPQAKFFVEHGYTVFTPDYRTYSRHSVSPRECVDDITAFWTMLHEKSESYGIDVDRIALGGGSAGAHIALMAVINTGLFPKVLILYNPALNPDSLPLKIKSFYPVRKNYPAPKKGYNYISFRDINVLAHFPDRFPPTILFHGKADIVIPYASSVRLTKKIRSKGAPVELYLYDGQNHGFFNECRNIDAFNDTNQKILTFLTRYL